MSSHPIIFFDGVCNLCNAVVDLVIKRDKARRFRYASLQSERGIELCRQYGYSTDRFETILLVEGEFVTDRSTAALRIAKLLGWPYRFLFAFIILPRIVRDPLYMVISGKRYAWFGKSESCRIPTPEEKALFLD